MKQFSRFLFFLFLINNWSSYGQKDSIVALDIVVLSDVKLKNFSTGFNVNEISDSIIKTQSSLTNLLNLNTLIYFKENGYGMVSSPSFRGTNASQTAVIWNGINVNSQLTGQADFNNISIINYNNISVKSGGSSVQYGSGAIGGSVHLNNSFHFYNHFNNEFQVSYGSFNTLNTSYKLSIGTDKKYFTVGIDYKNSENDYEYLGYGEKNKNGAYNFLGFNFNAGYFINENVLLKLFHNSSFNDRNLSGTLTYNAKDAYENTNSKTLLVLDFLTKKFSSNLNFAHIYEDYKYFPNSENSNQFSFGKVTTFVVKYDASLYLKSYDLELKGILEYDGVNGTGSNIGDNQRDVFSAVFLLNHKLTSKIDYSVNVRTEVTSQYNIPFIFSIGSNFQITKLYTLKFNTSKNYRIPTFNDLYWVPGGNVGLKPENSYQFEIGNDFNFDSQKFNLTGYYIKSEDMIKWLPNTNNIWSPINIEEAESYGIEFQYKILKKIGNNKLELLTNYGYTISKNSRTNKQLIYVPKNKITGTVSYNCKNFSAYYQLLYNGSVYTTTDNSSDLSSYDVSDVGISYVLPNKRKLTTTITFKAQNIFNEKYQNVAYRPMPNRNYKLKLILNF
ncbi:TonB-dependent receptor plug domain-containing protein [Lutibacter sp.]